MRRAGTGNRHSVSAAGHYDEGGRHDGFLPAGREHGRRHERRRDRGQAIGGHRDGGQRGRHTSHLTTALPSAPDRPDMYKYNMPQAHFSGGCS